MQTAFAILIKKLQENLTQIESFKVVTVSHGIDGMFPISPISNVNLDLKQSSASMLAQQLLLCLVTGAGESSSSQAPALAAGTSASVSATFAPTAESSAAVGLG